jgi:hypothetical protein
MPQDDLKDTVEKLDKEMTDRTTDIVTLEGRVRVLEQDVKTLVFLCHYIRDFTTVRVSPAADASFEKFNVAFSELMQRYEVPSP